jgi:hypothetical protein
MPRIVELLGFATVAAGGMFVAIALAPMPAHPGGAHAVAPAAVAATGYSSAPIVHLPPVEVVGRRSVEFARQTPNLPNTKGQS